MSTPLSDTDIAGFSEQDTEAITVLMRGGDTLERAITRVRRLRKYGPEQAETAPAAAAAAQIVNAAAWSGQEWAAARAAGRQLTDMAPRFQQGLRDISDGRRTNDAANARAVLYAGLRSSG